MQAAKLCQYVKHYIEEDKTRSAIMLNGEWGTGKSYFIENNLVPSLTSISSKSQGHQCLVISLYGVSSLSEVSQTLLLRMLSKGHPKKPKLFGKFSQTAIEGGNFVLQTLIKSGANKWNIDLGNPDKLFSAIQNSIDLAKVLIIFEDIERTGIDLIEFMGYVNNLVEHNHAKILLVANEAAIIETEEIMQDTQDGKKKVSEYTEATLEYLRIKEKTISDTICFECDEESAIRQIMEDYSALNELTTAEVISDVSTIMLFKKDHNLRSFLFACQKTSDIFKCLTGIQCQKEFKKAIFYGIVAFSMNWKQNNLILWKGDEFLSVDLGIANYPLFKFCYDYIKFQIIDCKNIPLAQTAFENLQRYDVTKSRNDPDIVTICSWYIKSEQQVLEAIRSIEARLDNPDDLSYYEYGNIVVNLLNMRDRIGVSIEGITEKIIENLHGKANVLNQNQLFYMTIDANDRELYSEYKEITAKMIASMNKSEDELMGWDYDPGNAAEMYNYFLKHRDTLRYEGRFILGLNPEKFVKMFLAANAEQMHDLRGIILAIYPHDSISVPSDSECIILSSMLEQLKGTRDSACLDKIQNMHCDYFVEHLSSILSRKS